MSDFLRDQTSGGLAGWLAYLRVDDEAQAQRTAIAILKAFNAGSKQPTQQADDDETPIDTTNPEFAKRFKGFTNTPVQQGRSQRPMRSTEIKIG